VEPAVAVEGVGAVGELLPPAAAVYHFRSVPIAVRTAGVAFWQ